MIKSIFLLSFVPFSAAYAGEKTACYNVEGMTCAACSLTIKTAVKKMDGIASVAIDAKTDSVRVVFDDQNTTAAKIAQAITDAGYRASAKTCAN